jgi:ferric-dicitrate binding protein FerR (iron transport regulator)
MARHEAEALWALAAGELDAQARARVEAHVAACTECAQRLEEVREARAQLQVVRGQEPAVRWAEVDDRILTMAAQRMARLERRPRWPWALAVVGACAAAALALVLLPPGEVTPPTSPPVAQVEPPPLAAPTVEVEGEAGAWAREAGGAEQALQPGTGLRAGTAVRTPARGGARLKLPDASRMQLSADSEVVLSRVDAEDVHLQVVRGQVSVQASHVERRGFVVEAAGVRTVVVGTVFSVERMPQGAAVSVLEGQVRVEAEGQPPRQVTAGERVEWHAAERAWKHRALSAEDQRAFEALGVRVEAPEPLPPARDKAQVKAAPLPRSAAAPTPSLPAVSPAPEPAPDSSPHSGQEPPPSAPEELAQSTPPLAAANDPTSPPPAPVPPAPPATASALPPGLDWQGSPAPRHVEERFLRYAREEMSYRTCESFLFGLGELAEQSRVREFREEARYLRARCFETRFSAAEAKAEYQLYLQEYPRGRWAREARVALLP